MPRVQGWLKAAYSIFSTASISAAVIGRKLIASLIQIDSANGKNPAKRPGKKSSIGSQPALTHAAHGLPQLALAFWLIHQQFQARQRPGSAQPFDLQLAVVGVGSGFPGKTNRRQPHQPQATARVLLVQPRA